MTGPRLHADHQGLLGIIAAFFAARPEPEPDLLVIGPCDRATEPELEPEPEAGI
jgi:hypothetical protein